MKLNKKSLLVACVLAAMSTSAFAVSTTTSTTSTTVMNQDTPTSTSTRVTREEHSFYCIYIYNNDYRKIFKSF